MKAFTFSEGLPVIARSGCFELLNPVFEFTYRNPTHVIHLYDYSGSLRIGSKLYKFKPGDITCIQSGTVYSFETQTPGSHWCIHYSESKTEGSHAISLPIHLELGAKSLFYREQMQLINRLSNTQLISDESKPMQLEASYRLKSLLLSLHNLKFNQSRGIRRRSHFSCDALLEWIDKNLSQPISIPILAEHVNLAPGTLSKKFKESFGTTLTQYLLHRRIDKAKSLLATTPLTIYEVGHSVGIPDPQYFNKQFRKVTTLSPTQYRDENIEYFSHSQKDMATKEGSWQH